MQTNLRGTRITPHLARRLAACLTPRDYWILGMLYEHRTLNTPQLVRACFPSARAATGRLTELHRLGVLDRFRPWRPTGTAAYHWVVSSAGAWVLAASVGVTPDQIGYRPEQTRLLAVSSQLGHVHGIAEIFTQLIHTSRTSSTLSLAAWWSQRSCARQWGEHARPDAYARITSSRTVLDLFLEYDTGSEPLGRVVDKLSGYTRLATATGITTPVLFVVTTPTRETNLAQRLAATDCGVPTVTTNVQYAATAGGYHHRIWSLPGRDGCCDFAELAAHWPAPTRQPGPDDAAPGHAWSPPTPIPPTPASWAA